MGHNATTAAAKALRLLNSPDLRHPAARGPQVRRSPSTTPSAPLDLGIVDHMTRTVADIADHTMHVNPQAGPLPARVEDIYDWYIANTGDADEAERRYRDALIELHRLEHAVRLGEVDEVCKHPCPRCGCWGVMWPPGGSRAECTNRRCRTPDGMSSTWTLEQLAAQKVQRTEIWRRNAT